MHLRALPRLTSLVQISAVISRYLIAAHYGRVPCCTSPLHFSRSGCRCIGSGSCYSPHDKRRCKRLVAEGVDLPGDAGAGTGGITTEGDPPGSHLHRKHRRMEFRAIDVSVLCRDLARVAIDVVRGGISCKISRQIRRRMFATRIHRTEIVWKNRRSSSLASAAHKKNVECNCFLIKPETLEALVMRLKLAVTGAALAGLLAMALQPAVAGDDKKRSNSPPPPYQGPTGSTTTPGYAERLGFILAPVTQQPPQLLLPSPRSSKSD